MKGQVQIPTEVMIKALAFIILTITILGVLFAVSQYQVTYESRVGYRQLIDFMENFLSARCVAYEENGNLWKGVLDESKLDSYSPCVQYHKNVYIEIKDMKNEWKFGTKPSGFKVEEELSYPVVIKYSDEFVPGRMEVKTYT